MRSRTCIKLSGSHAPFSRDPEPERAGWDSPNRLGDRGDVDGHDRLVVQQIQYGRTLRNFGLDGS